MRDRTTTTLMRRPHDGVCACDDSADDAGVPHGRLPHGGEELGNGLSSFPVAKDTFNPSEKFYGNARLHLRRPSVFTGSLTES